MVVYVSFVALELSFDISFVGFVHIHFASSFIHSFGRGFSLHMLIYSTL